MFTEATEDCRQYILLRAPTARITRSQAVDLEKKWICLIVNVNINHFATIGLFLFAILHKSFFMQ